MREALYSILVNDPAVTTLIPAARIKESASVTDTPDFTVGKLVIIRMRSSFDGVRKEDASLRGGQQARCALFAYDERGGSYEDLDRILRTARTALLAAPPHKFTGPDGDQWLNSVTWEGDSEDFFDEPWNAITKNAAFLLTGSGF